MELAAPGTRGGPGQLDRRIAVSAGCATVALAIACGSAAIAATAGASDLAILTRGLIAGVPAAVGLRTVARGDNARFGVLLTAVGAVLAVSTLAESGGEVAYSLGRAAGWLVELLLVYLILSFPTGRLTTSTDRALVAAAVLVVLTLFVPRLFLAGQFDLPSPYTSCTEGCPDNAFLVPDQPAGIAAWFLRPAGALLWIAISAAVVLRLLERVRSATPLARRMFIPVLAVGIARMCLIALGFAVRHADPGIWPVHAIAGGLALSAPVIALAFLVALVRWQLDAAGGLERLAELVREFPDTAALRHALADAFHDPTLHLVPVGSTYPVVQPVPGSGSAVSQVRDRNETVVAAVVHDEALLATPRFLGAGLAMAGVVLENQRLAAEAETAANEIQRSRMRIAAGAERERRRIERDLHDGAQQRLVALRIELELAEELVRNDPRRGLGRLRELEEDVDDALEELRSLAHGVYPPLLADRGLDEALRRVTARCPIPVEVDLREVGRYTPEVESAVYFCVMEALQNILKHAEGARRVVVRVDGGFQNQLRFSVRDDGIGARDDRIEAGAGITNMRDRLAAVEGEVTISSLRAVGTAVRGWIPVGRQRVE